MVGGMEETSDSAITGQSILATIGERLPAMVIPGGKSFLFLFLFPSPISLFFFCRLLSFSFSFLSLLSFYSLSPFSFVLSPLSFVLCPLSFVLSLFSFLICPFSRLSHFVAQISANVNIYRIDSSFLHIICAFLA